MAKVMAALSGGVDSAVAALLLQKAGNECAGAIMLLHGPAPDSVSDAQKTNAQQREKLLRFFQFDFRLNDSLLHQLKG